jgi:hypothetical protein
VDSTRTAALVAQAMQAAYAHLGIKCETRITTVDRDGTTVSAL